MRVLRGRLLRALLVCVLTALAPSTWAGGVTVTVVGRVAHPGVEHLAVGARLSDAALKAAVQPDAYPLGAAWLRASLQPVQARWKAGLMYEIGLVRGQARIDDKPDLEALAVRLQGYWRALPATGRELRQLMDPRPLEVSDQNHLLGNGDRLVYPPRPDTVRVMGAVQQPCTLRFTPMRSGREYRNQCPLALSAASDWLYVIEPDGHIIRRGIGLWNGEPPQMVAPGAIVYIPITRSQLPASIRGDFNLDATRFLATQVLPLQVGQQR